MNYYTENTIYEYTTRYKNLYPVTSKFNDYRLLHVKLKWNAGQELAHEASMFWMCSYAQYLYKQVTLLYSSPQIFSEPSQNQVCKVLKSKATELRFDNKEFSPATSYFSCIRMA